jgi:phosphate acetyltransferase
MTKAIYITAAESHTGKSLISLGITELLLRKTRRVGIFRPIISQKTPQQRDKNIDLIVSYFNLDVDYDETYAFLGREVNELIVQGRYGDVLDEIIKKYKELENRYDFLLCIGTDFISEGSAFEFNINADIARNLGIPVLVIGHAADRTIEEAVSPILLAVESFIDQECQVLGVIVNRADPDRVSELLETLKKRLPVCHECVSVIPTNRVLGSPTIKEIVTHLNADILYGEDQLQRQAYRYLIVAMHLQNYLSYLSENAVIITPGDRGDIILSALQAHQSKNYPNLAAILLTTGFQPAPDVKKLLDGLPSLIPILSVKTDTYETTRRIGTIYPYISADNHAKIALSLRLFEEYVDTQALEEQISAVESKGMTPRMFLYNLVQKAKAKKQRIVLPESTDPRILKATEILLSQEIVDIILLGKEEEIRRVINREGRRIDLSKVSVIDPASSPCFFDYVQTLYELRKDKGLTLDAARELMTDISYFGTMMVYKGDADGMVSGAVHTTQHTIRPALQFVKTKPGFSVVSSVFFMCLEDRVLVYGDCAVNPNPTAEQLSEIAISSADTARAFGVEPKVALLSYSSGESGQGEDVEKVRTATRLAQEKRPDLELEGPIQYDAAVDKDVAQQKMPNSTVAGEATVLIFPDLNTGNNTYKAVQRETGAIAIGPILQGLNKPVNDLSRGCTVQDVINTIVITAIQAQDDKA